MKRRRKYKINNEISRPGAIFMAVLSFFVTCVFFGTFRTNTSIEKNATDQISAIFDYYELPYRRHHSLPYAILFFKNGEKEFIPGACVNENLKNELAELEKGTELHMLISENSDDVVELKTNSKTLLSLDYSQKMLKQEGKGFLFMSVLTFVVFCYSVYKAITTKERITKADIKFYWNTMRGK